MVPGGQHEEKEDFKMANSYSHANDEHHDKHALKIRDIHPRIILSLSCLIRGVAIASVNS